MWVRNRAGDESILLLTDENGGPMSMDILPFVADPVSVTGEVVRVGDLLQLRADVAAFQRVYFVPRPACAAADFPKSRDKGDALAPCSTTLRNTVT